MPTRTKNGFFVHPHLTEGTVNFEDEQYPVAAGVVEAPLEIGEGAHWAHANGVQVDAHKAARAEAEESDESGKGKSKGKTKKADKADGQA
jgi:hypothetical protein